MPKLSPLDASARYLSHLRAAWGHAVARGDASLALERQVVTLTVPASFDAVARELTVEAARLAGLPDLVLLEEPQAALYAWVDAMGDRWRKLVRPGELILVVDVGGGTTDFSLIAVVDRDGELALERVAVGDHILLGGDNMDLALAHRLEQKLAASGKKIDRWQLVATHECCSHLAGIECARTLLQDADTAEYRGEEYEWIAAPVSLMSMDVSAVAKKWTADRKTLSAGDA